MDYQNYQVVLSPDLGLSAEEFVKAWNDNPESRTVSEARLSAAKGTSFEPITIAVILVTIGTGIATDVISELIKNLIQDIREKRKQQLVGTALHKKIQIEQLDKPEDGTHHLLVDIEE